jgi:hypothetical protein
MLSDLKGSTYRSSVTMHSFYQWGKVVLQWIAAAVLLPPLVVLMLIKPDWFITSDEPDHI